MVTCLVSGTRLLGWSHADPACHSLCDLDMLFNPLGLSFPVCKLGRLIPASLPRGLNDCVKLLSVCVGSRCWVRTGLGTGQSAPSRVLAQGVRKEVFTLCLGRPASA